jgi:hypothetical protein
MQAGLRVRAIDASGEMVRIARDRGVDAEVLSIENCGLLNETFDAVLSNFGALNCVEDLDRFASRLAAWFALAVTWRSALSAASARGRRPGPCCAASRPKPSAAGAGASMSSLGRSRFYPSRKPWKLRSAPSSRS